MYILTYCNVKRFKNTQRAQGRQMIARLFPDDAGGRPGGLSPRAGVTTYPRCHQQRHHFNDSFYF